MGGERGKAKFVAYPVHIVIHFLPATASCTNVPDRTTRAEPHPAQTSAHGKRGRSCDQPLNPIHP